MQFLVLAHDGSDAEAPARRQMARADHLRGLRALKAAGNFIYGGALLDDQGAMIGSAIIFDFPDRAALDQALAQDPYVVGKVWQKIEVRPFRTAQMD